jgi:hypothetical protein
MDEQTACRNAKMGANALLMAILGQNWWIIQANCRKN